MKNAAALTFLSFLTLLAGCADPGPVPDYRIRVLQNPDGSYVAIPPECPSWADYTTSSMDNQPVPQFGCASARNLAVMVDDAKDLLHGRDSEQGDGTVTAAGIDRYRTGQTKALIDPQASSSSSSGGSTGQ